MNVRFFGSQLGAETAAPLCYTGSPLYLFVHDVLLFCQWIRYIPYIVIPIVPCPHKFDELHRSPSNVYCMVLHLIAFICQTAFLLSLPFFLYLPFPLYIAYVFSFIISNRLFCRLLNGKIPDGGLKSTEDDETEKWVKHPDESWIFLNGVAVGDHWLQSNIDQISRTFYRPVIGIHNQTSGIMFDVIQCLIQRCLLYATPDVRDCYVLVKKALYREGCNKVILILHSQGGIEGSMIIDWLLNEVPQSKLQALEVYTFGNAANHFNNPYRGGITSLASNGSSETKYSRGITHIEHYANNKDFVACWGVLSYTKTIPQNQFENRFMGRVFERDGKGHQFNQHYLDNMFPLNASGYGAREPQAGDFMAMNCEVDNGHARIGRESAGQSLSAAIASSEVDVHLFNESPSNSRQGTVVAENWETTNVNGNGNTRTKWTVQELSRLWMYRNGGPILESGGGES